MSVRHFAQNNWSLTENFIIIIIIFYYVSCNRPILPGNSLETTVIPISCHRPILPGNSLEPTVIPTAQASSFTLQYFPYYV
jgi:hypothetical protein